MINLVEISKSNTTNINIYQHRIKEIAYAFHSKKKNNIIPSLHCFQQPLRNPFFHQTLLLWPPAKEPYIENNQVTIDMKEKEKVENTKKERKEK